MASWTSAIKDWANGAVVQDTDLDTNLRDFATAFAAWGSYTPVWTGATTDPVLNNGTLTGAYMQVQKTVSYRIALTIGSTTTQGTGAWLFSLPVAANAAYLVNHAAGVWTGTPAGVRTNGVAAVYTTTSKIFLEIGGASTNAAVTVPGVWATGNVVYITGTYEAA